MSETSQPAKPVKTPVNKQGEIAHDKTREEFGGQSGPEPTRYGDWEKNGRCTDF